MFHRFGISGVFWLAFLPVCLSCGGSSIPIPYLVEQSFDELEECVTDFNAEEGSCISIEDGVVVPFCRKQEDRCVEHFYIQRKSGRPFIVHINAKYPCYSEWLIERYSDPDGTWYRHSNYRVVSLELANEVVDDVVHLIEVLRQDDLQTGDTCYYRLEAGIKDLSAGEYGLKLWNPDRQLILGTKFNR